MRPSACINEYAIFLDDETYLLLIILYAKIRLLARSLHLWIVEACFFFLLFFHSNWSEVLEDVFDWMKPDLRFFMVLKYLLKPAINIFTHLVVPTHVGI